MSYSLYVDSSHNLTIGLLDNDLKWVDFKCFSNKKSSGVFHGLVDELLTSYQLDLFKIDRVFHSAGPGSYTGVRLVEGFSQILQWQEIKTNSFNLFDLPLIAGVNRGKWISEAHKGEYFIYSWDDAISKRDLIKKEDLKSYVTTEDYLVSHGDIAVIETLCINDLIEKNSQVLFKKLIELDIKAEPFYYRSIENEFNKPIQLRRGK